MKKTTSKRIAVILIPIAALALLGAVAWLVLRFVTLPPCMFYTFLHIHCPGCGMTRSVRALLSGDVLLSIRQNAMLLFLLIAAALYYTEFAIKVWGGSFRFALLHKSWVIYTALILLGVYLIVRNFIPAIAPI